MKLERVSLMGLTTFRGPLDVDFRELGDGLISLSGPNGAGKTTILESPLVALFRQFPSRPNLYDYAHGRDAYVEAVFSHEGHELQGRVLIDAEARKMEGYLTVDGEPASSGKAREYQAAVEQHFGTLPLLLASVFASQARDGDFLRASRAERKALFAELLGLGYLDQLAAGAGERRGTAKTAADTLTGQRRDLEERVAAGRDLSSMLTQARQHHEQAAREASDRDDQYQAAKAEAERVREAGRQLHARAAQLERWVADGEKRLAELQVRRGAVAQWVAQAKQRYVRLRDQPDTIPAERERVERDHDAALQRLAGRRETAQELLGRAEEIRGAADRCEMIGAEMKEARAGQTMLDEERAEVRQVQARVEALTAALAQDQAACLGVDDGLYQRCPLVVTSRSVAQEAKDAERKLEIARDVLATTERFLAGKPTPESLREEYDGLQPAAGLLGALQRAEADAPKLDEEEDELLRQKTMALAALEEREAKNRGDLDLALDEYRQAEATASLQHAELDDEQEQADAALVAARAELAALERPAETPDLEAPGAALKEARVMEKAAAATLSRLEYQLEALKDDTKRLEDVAARLEAATAEAWEWQVLGDALGRNGAQALEVDAAGPAVAERANALLEACYGPRFSIAFETLREKRSARGEYTEVFDIHVYDGSEQRQVEGLSGGEKVIVGEALSLALAIYNAQRSNVRWETLWRDETAGALDPSNAQAYVDMLRRAMDLGGFRQVIYVSHVPDVWERADVALRVEGGRVSR